MDHSYRDSNIEALLGGPIKTYYILSYIEKFKDYGNRQRDIDANMKNMLEAKGLVELKAYIPHLTLRSKVALDGLRPYMKKKQKRNVIA